MRSKDRAWESIFSYFKLHKYDFESSSLKLSAEQIKLANHLPSTGEREVRILCKQDTRESRPEVFQERGLFILPIKNGEYLILKGEGYIDIPKISEPAEKYVSKLGFELDTSKIGDSEMQHLDFSYAASLIRTFVADDTLVLTIRGRKYTPDQGFSFRVGKHHIEVKSVQTELDAGYEGRDQIVLIEAKTRQVENTIIRQLFYPFRQWKYHSKKRILILFFEKNKNQYCFWQFQFTDEHDYNSIEIVKTKKFLIA